MSRMCDIYLENNSSYTQFSYWRFQNVRCLIHQVCSTSKATVFFLLRLKFATVRSTIFLFSTYAELFKRFVRVPASILNKKRFVTVTAVVYVVLPTSDIIVAIKAIGSEKKKM